MRRFNKVVSDQTGTCIRWLAFATMMHTCRYSGDFTAQFRGGAAPKVSDAMMDLALKLCPVNVYAYNNIYLAYNKKWWTL
jgi:hypothetical protein